MTRDIALTGTGLLTSCGLGIDASIDALRQGQSHRSWEDYGLGDFKAAKHLSERRILKSISPHDARALVALEDCMRHSGLNDHTYDPYRVGLYVSASPLEDCQYDSFIDSVEATKDQQGRYREAECGVTGMNARPNTLLVGLVNNVLCYGSILLQAKGPNSNYTSMDIGSHLALMTSAKKIRRGQIDCAIAGGYCTHHDSMYTGMLDYQNALRTGTSGDEYVIEPYESGRPGTIIAHGAAFTAVEDGQKARDRNAPILGYYRGGAISCDGKGPLTIDSANPALVAAMTKALSDADLVKEDIGVVFLSGHGIPSCDLAEATSVRSVFGSSAEKPALASTCRLWGNVVQAGGIGEIYLLPHLYAAGSVPTALRVGGRLGDFPTSIATDKRAAMIIRVSIDGDYSCVIVEIPKNHVA